MTLTHSIILFFKKSKQQNVLKLFYCVLSHVYVKVKDKFRQVYVFGVLRVPWVVKVALG
jgi:hypothetical protein